MTNWDYQAGFAAGVGEGKRQAKPGGFGHGVRRVLVWFLGLLAAFITGIVTSGTDHAHNALCEMLPAKGQQAVNVACGKAHQRIAQAEAEAVIDHYLGAASGARPQRAWYWLSSQMQKEWPSKDDYAAQFDNVLWYERVFDIKPVNDPTAFNRFTVHFYAFTGKDNEHPDLDVNEYVQDVQLTRSGTVTKISDLAPPDRPNTYRWYYPRIRTASREEIPEDMRGYGAPSTSALDGGDTSLAHGGWLYPICQLETAEGSWVYAPGSGWIPDKFIENGSSGMEGMAYCDKHLLVKTQPAPPAPTQ